MNVNPITFPEVMHIIARLFDTDRPEERVRDSALLLSAIGRPTASMFGQEAYPGIHHKAAALLHGLAKNHSLFDGNKRLALVAALFFYAKNGYWNTIDIEGEYQFMLDVASDELDSIDEIAAWLGERFAPEAQ
ncbi:type II toxin-antitoxin system death-on-curing family toxin [Herbiconiux sp. KACC 21604]|uniref:type II toxin-antitoxin system death-on-curing family toxin n=1 Tax=unclassified Herbiconiux TaxID=2618217 RepID=UPI001C103711|nr:type II toxin-antitoxin system death-on-curing family toxin [Herbiconiux sp. SALV-R1]WPO87671.1 type II toxin-antitoxin system death-on-curing family toxin [Herbiconiux sp. KACC 21604]